MDRGHRHFVRLTRTIPSQRGRFGDSVDPRQSHGGATSSTYYFESCARAFGGCTPSQIGNTAEVTLPAPHS